MNGYDSDDGPRPRSRSSSDTSSSRSQRGTRTLDCVPEKLIDNSRRTRALGLAFVDNGANISEALANVVSNKAFRLVIITKNRRTDEKGEPFVGQVGLIRGKRLSASPPTQRRAIVDADGDRPILRSSHFEATPTTCLHNVSNHHMEESGDWLDYQSADIVSPAGNEISITTFAGAGYEPSQNNEAEIRPPDRNGRGRIAWRFGHDVTTAQKLENGDSYFTMKTCTFEKVDRDDYSFQVGQKIGLAVFRDFEVTCEDAGLPPRHLTAAELEAIYGHPDRVNIYTGEILRVSQDGSSFEHNINTYKGCSGALVFLLDRDQNGNGTLEADWGKAIAVHVGGKFVEEGRPRNFAFKLL